MKGQSPCLWILAGMVPSRHSGFPHGRTSIPSQSLIPEQFPAHISKHRTSTDQWLSEAGELRVAWHFLILGAATDQIFKTLKLSQTATCLAWIQEREGVRHVLSLPAFLFAFIWQTASESHGTSGGQQYSGWSPTGD